MRNAPWMPPLGVGCVGGCGWTHKVGDTGRDRFPDALLDNELRLARLGVKERDLPWAKACSRREPDAGEPAPAVRRAAAGNGAMAPYGASPQ